jgi:hypothetical protein
MQFQPYKGGGGPDFLSLALRIRQQRTQEESQKRRDEAALIRAQSQAQNDELSRQARRFEMAERYGGNVADIAGLSRAVGETRDAVGSFVEERRPMPQVDLATSLDPNRTDAAFDAVTGQLGQRAALENLGERELQPYEQALREQTARQARLLQASRPELSDAQAFAIAQRDVSATLLSQQADEQRELTKTIAAETRGERVEERKENRVIRNLPRKLRQDPKARLEFTNQVLNMDSISDLIDLQGAGDQAATRLLDDEIQAKAQQLSEGLGIPYQDALEQVTLAVNSTFAGNEQARAAAERVKELDAARTRATNKISAAETAKRQAEAPSAQIEFLSNKIESLEQQLADPTISPEKRRNLERQLATNNRRLDSIGYRNVAEAKAGQMVGVSKRRAAYRDLYAMTQVYREFEQNPELFGVGANVTLFLERVKGFGLDVVQLMQDDIARNLAEYSQADRERLALLSDGIIQTEDNRLANLSIVRLEEVAATWFLLRGMNQSGRVARAQIEDLFRRMNVSEFTVPANIGKARVQATLRNFERQLVNARNGLRDDDIEFEIDGRIVGDERLPPPLYPETSQPDRAVGTPGAGLGTPAPAEDAANPVSALPAYLR